ncbi:MAG: response regulator [Lachnospiraceae bacterium]|nr:response regulator [Lachnospiraceae bacterium]
MNQVILVVDDDTSNLALAQKILGKEYRIAAANSGKVALKYLENNCPDLILLDINMPEMDGFQVLEEVQRMERFSHVPVIFLTADNDPETETRCFATGAVDFVAKPFIPDVLMSRVKKTLELEIYRANLEHMVEEQTRIITARTRRISQIQEQVIMGMATLIETRDNSTGKHVKNTMTYVKMIASELKARNIYSDILTEDYIMNVYKAAPLHDVGKIKISDAILRKPGRLTEEEYNAMKLHTVYGREIINEIIGGVEDPAYVKIAEDIAMYHHERWDGTGYPIGLKGEDIPLCARIMALADVFDALYEERCYKEPIRPVYKIMQTLKEGRGTQFDPLITDVFTSLEQEIKDLLGELL